MPNTANRPLSQMNHGNGSQGSREVPTSPDIPNAVGTEGKEAIRGQPISDPPSPPTRYDADYDIDEHLRLREGLPVRNKTNHQRSAYDADMEPRILALGEPCVADYLRGLISEHRTKEALAFMSQTRTTSGSDDPIVTLCEAYRTLSKQNEAAEAAISLLCYRLVTMESEVDKWAFEISRLQGNTSNNVVEHFRELYNDSGNMYQNGYLTGFARLRRINNRFGEISVTQMRDTLIESRNDDDGENEENGEVGLEAEAP
ncbi:hypothetical protein FB567DRAFT_598372 [Paraphoma chrysanthemicola]|uniref:Uncharacterized protein n=1 Tax=Paraphoma chrysanthemicola TaxID=798071 RepID=A0A8K0QU83_9PLEO|nr:hypothetical protein FB567DRAFT_598372 [Paraphoma chrysanthemicola]